MSDGSATLGPVAFTSGRWRVHRVRETGSTNADLLAAFRAGEPPDAVLVADHQTAGKGRFGRAWQAPPGSSLLVSVLLRPARGASLHGATWALGLAGRDACLAATGVDVGLKWPNDLVVGDRKLAGILAEAVVEDGRVSAVVPGMGLNVQWPPPAELPGELAERVVALNHLAGGPVDREELLRALVAALDERVTQWEERPVRLLADLRRHLVTLGRRVRVELPDGSFEGLATDVDDDGALIVETDAGTRVVGAGDVVHLR